MYLMFLDKRIHKFALSKFVCVVLSQQIFKVCMAILWHSGAFAFISRLRLFFRGNKLGCSFEGRDLLSKASSCDHDFWISRFFSRRRRNIPLVSCLLLISRLSMFFRGILQVILFSNGRAWIATKSSFRPEIASTKII